VGNNSSESHIAPPDPRKEGKEGRFKKFVKGNKGALAAIFIAPIIAGGTLLYIYNASAQGDPNLRGKSWSDFTEMAEQDKIDRIVVSGSRDSANYLGYLNPNSAEAKAIIA
jgi:hypothetical protein